jgi:DNA-directed RNA polymerase specialized sigma24 family protein
LNDQCHDLSDKQSRHLPAGREECQKSGGNQVGASRRLAFKVCSVTLAFVTTSTHAASPETTSTGEVTPRQSAFVTTHWSVVLTAGHSDTTRAHEALSSLCKTYWYPLYAYVRRRGHSPEDAKDSTQDFFARLLAGNWVADADRAKGRFRTFLLTALNRFLANEWNHAQAQKRGGGSASVPLDTAMAERRYCADTGIALAPDCLYDRQWAMTLLDRALNRLEAENQRSGKAAEFATLSPALTAERGDIPYAAMAAQLNLSEPATRMAVHRLRKRFREVFREEIAQTVAQPDEVEEEIRYLLAALAA